MKKTMVWVLVLNIQCGFATNLLSNGEFNANTNGWTNPTLTPTWNDQDGNYSGPGSMQFGTNLNNGSNVYMISEKMAVTFGHHYVWGASFKIPSDSGSEYTNVAINWYNDNGDWMGEYPFLPYDGVVTDDTWLDFDHELEHIVPGATQIEVWLYVPGNSNGGNELSYARWDDVFFVADTIMVTGFE